MSKAWVGFDLDGTLAWYNKWQSIYNIGEPIPAMVDKLHEEEAAGFEIKIFTARVVHGPDAIFVIKEWCKTCLGKEYEVTNVKDFKCVKIYDDRAVSVRKNVGWTANANDTQHTFTMNNHTQTYVPLR